MSHLSESLLGTLVDGRLRPDQADDVVAHVAACPRCRDRVLAERATRCILATAGDLRPSPDLTARLLAMGISGAVPAGYGPPDLPRSRGPARRLLVWFGAVAVSGATALGGLYVLGGDLPPGLDSSDIASAAVPVLPAAQRVPAAAAVPATFIGVADRTSTTLAWLREGGWSVPAVVPATLEVVDVRQSPEGVLVVELAGQDSSVLVLQWRGTLDPSVLTTSLPLRPGGGDAHLVSTAPWTAVKQSGAVAVAVVCHGPLHHGRQVMAAIPYAEPAMAPAARIGRGWSAVTASAAWVTGR